MLLSECAPKTVAATTAPLQQEIKLIIQPALRSVAYFKVPSAGQSILNDCVFSFSSPFFSPVDIVAEVLYSVSQYGV